MTRPTEDNFDPTEPTYMEETTQERRTERVEQPLNDAPVPAVTSETTPPPRESNLEHKVQGSIAGGTWVALILGTLLLILLLVFIMQNQQSVDLHLFAWDFSFPAGVGFLLAAIAGALIMALVGGVRMFELRRQIKRKDY